MPGGIAASRCECTRALGQACPPQRAVSSPGGCVQHDGSGHRDCERDVVSRPRNHFTCWYGVPTLTLNKPDEVRSTNAEQIGLVEHDTRRPVLAHPLALDGARRVRREDDAVVLVRLVDDAVGADAHEVDGDAEHLRREVREPVRGRLVGDAARVAQVLDRDVLGRLGLEQPRPQLLLRHEDGRREVVDLDALGEELGVVGRHLVAEDEVPERLQRERTRVVLARLRLRQVDPAIGQIADGARRVRQIRGVHEREPEVLRHPIDGGARDRPARMPDAGEKVGGCLLDVTEVVVGLPHARA